MKEIKHFLKEDTDVPGRLKAKVTELRKKHHPDKFPESKKQLQHSIMAEINAEYDYLCTHTFPAVPAPKKFVFNGKFSRYEDKSDNDELKKQAKDIHDSIFKTEIDYNLLMDTFDKVKDWEGLFITYTSIYGKQITIHLVSKIKDKKLRMSILEKMMKLSGNEFGNSLLKIFTSFKFNL